MSEYPEDIMKAAREAIAKYYVDTGETDFAKRIQEGHKDDWWMSKPVAAAILAERERCAKVAIDRFTDANVLKNARGRPYASGQAAIVAANYISAAILKGGAA